MRPQGPSQRVWGSVGTEGHPRLSTRVYSGQVCLPDLKGFVQVRELGLGCSRCPGRRTDVAGPTGWRWRSRHEIVGEG